MDGNIAQSCRAYVLSIQRSKISNRLDKNSTHEIAPPRENLSNIADKPLFWFPYRIASVDRLVHT